MDRALVLDANERSALAATRALGRAGVSVATAERRGESLAGHSRYSVASWTYPDPYEDPDGFVGALPELAHRAGAGVILPMTEVTTYLIAKHRDRFAEFAVPMAAFDAFEALSDKCRLFELAQQLGVPTPRTWFASNATDAARWLHDVPYPVVIKPFRSRILDGGRWLNTAVRFARDPLELEERLAVDPALQRFPFMLQERVSGHGAGIFALYDHGAPAVFFAHRRIRERPPRGGVSVLSESVAVREDMVGIARQLLGAVAWHGAAMVEFKVAGDGTPYLMEINPRLWGSLQLAVDAGVNFPLMLYRSALGQPMEHPTSYRTGQRLRWLLGDLDRLYLLYRDADVAAGTKLREALTFLNPGLGTVRYEVNRWGDLGPFWYELRHYLRD